MIRFLLAVLAIGAGIGAVRAEEAPARWRGTVEARDSDMLTIRRREGGTTTVLMNPKTRMFLATPVSLRDIKPESYVSIIAAPGADGAMRPTQVAIYSPSERGFEAGSRPWDTAPGATFTAGWIGGLSIDTPRHVELVYGGGSKAFTIPPETPATQIAPGERALLVPGAEVVAFVRTDGQGLINADLVAVARQGAVPSL